MKSILIVSQDQHLLQEFQQNLAAKFEVIPATNLKQALNSLQNSPAEVVICDQVMNGKSGTEILQRIQKKYPETIRYLLTTSTEQPLRVRRQSKRPIHYLLSKPVNYKNAESNIRKSIQAQVPEETNGRSLNIGPPRSESIVARLTGITNSIQKAPNVLIEHLPDWIWELDADFNFTYSNSHSAEIFGLAANKLMGQSPLELLKNRDGKQAMMTLLNSARQHPGKNFQNTIKAITKSGTQYFLDINLKALRFSSVDDLKFIGIAREITRQKQIQEMLQQREKELSLLLEASSYITTIRDQNELMHSMLKGATLAINSNGGCLFLFEETTQRFSIAATEGFSQKVLSKILLSLSDIKIGNPKGLVGIIGQTHAILCIDNVKKDPRWISVDPRIQSAMWLPIIYEERLLGVLNLFSHTQGKFDQSSVRLGKLFANKVAVALENIRLYSKIRQSEEQYRSVIENAYDIIYITDQSGKITYTNPQAQKLLGYSDDELKQKSIWEIISPEYRENVFRAYQLQFRKMVPQKYREFEVMDKNHQRHWLGENVSIIQRDNQPVGFQAICRDLTHRKNTEEALRVSEQRYRMLVESAYDMVVRIEANGNFSFVNSRFTNLLGYTPEQAKNMHYSRIFHEDSLKNFSLQMERLLSGEDFKIIDEFCLTKQSGQILEVDATITPIIEGSNVTAVQGILRNISEKKKVEAAIRSYEEKLRLVLENLTEIVYSLNIKDEFTFVSPTIVNLLNIPYTELLGQSIWKSFAPFVIEPSMITENRKRRQQRIAQGKQSMTFEFDLKIGNNVRTIEFFERFKFNSECSLVATHGIMREISERKEAERNIRQTLDGIIRAISSIIQYRDPYTAGHQRNTAKLATAIAKELKLDENRIEGLALAAILLDVGKIGIPAEILNKTSSLSEAEMSIIETHVVLGADILDQVPWPWDIVRFVREHHERIDGSGYPNGLKGDEICLEARILAIADSIDAMINHRPYRPAIPVDQAIHEIVEERYAHFDPVVMAAIHKLYHNNFFDSLSNSMFGFMF